MDKGGNRRRTINKGAGGLFQAHGKRGASAPDATRPLPADDGRGEGEHGGIGENGRNNGGTMPGLNLAATISLDGSGFERGMARIGASAASGIKNLIAGAVGVYALEAAFRKTIDTADELV